MTIKPGYTRISSILSQWDRFGAIDKTVLSAKASIGTEVHEAIEAYEQGVQLPLSDKAQGYYDSFLKWREESKGELVKSEMRLYCDSYKITGAVDAVMTFNGSSQPLIVDYKTSAVESPKMWQLQGGFYHYLAVASGFQLSSRILFVKLHPKGAAAKVCEYFYSRELFNKCVAALICYNHLNA